MANTNAIVEKLKDLGLRHGEKAGVAIASTLFFVCIGLAAKKETIDTSPEKIKAASRHRRATSTATKIARRSSRTWNKGIKDSDFAKVVDDQVKTALVPAELQGRSRVGHRPSRAPA